ncbi:MAG: WYL domain-containing protein [Oscillospiraceae bacterium]|nr:WYL domain-containing protein [Oscillospiraceae bacterium]
MAKKASDKVHDNDARLRLFYLYRLLEQYTDEDHPKTTNQLRNLMEEEHGIAMHRTTVYNDMELLKKAGVYIHCYRARAIEYYLESRKFELPELKLLIDAVESSRFMTESQSRSLTDKLITLTSDTNAGKLKRNLHVSGRVKAENKQIFYIVDAINEAINFGRRIAFQYIDYDSRKKEKLRNRGQFYTVSPYSLIWNGDYYYLVGYYHEKDDVRTFRVDRIKAQPEILEAAADSVPEDFDITRYTREVFRMYDTEEPVPVTLVCENEVMKGVLDAFGMDIKVKRAEKGHFQTTVMACTSPTFYGWVFQWGGKVRITAPKEAVQEYAAMAKEALSALENK